MKGLKQKQMLKERLKQEGNQLNTTFKNSLKEQLERFQQNLERFLTQNRVEINKNPSLRQEFYGLCREIGVDPLISSKGYWAEMFNDIQFYYDLAVQITTVCIALRQRTGGLLEVNDCLKWVNKLRGKNQITIQDMYKAIETLKVLGNGMNIMETGDCKMLVSVPLELNIDQKFVIERARDSGFVNHAMFPDWPRARFQIAVDALISEGLVWLDQVGKEKTYYFPGHSLLSS
ncbi:SNF8 [Blepharisma stoltei]|uniref:Vacuolar-sorting protein SNF8 n=1 Tax=Blepharisma stoltei TaxID=1481888 RepID=A0AAU9J163_9CILI|nr:unnamed protein product [Blepharisma stoltei]